jgi:iron-sulfur cluster repair protein YtfE (RIC family)
MTISRFASTVETFNRFGTDACCGGAAAAIADAAVRVGVDPGALRTELLRLIRDAP